MPLVAINPDTLLGRLIDFFRYYARDFSYNTGVASIRAGLLKKESKGWQNDVCLNSYRDNSRSLMMNSCLAGDTMMRGNGIVSASRYDILPKRIVCLYSLLGSEGSI